MAHDRRFRFGDPAERRPATPPSGPSSPARPRTSATRRCSCPTTSATSWPRCRPSRPRPTPPPTLRVGTLVLDNDYKHPVVHGQGDGHARPAVSDGRLELGIGAGWMASDYEQSGIPHRPARRAGRPAGRGASPSSRACSPPGPFSFSGEHYTITELDGLPKPVQQPAPAVPHRRRRRRGCCASPAREADIVGINPALRSGKVDAEAASDGAAAAPTRRSRWVQEAAGDRYDDLELNMLVFAAVVTDDRAGTIEAMPPLFGVAARGAGARSPTPGRHRRPDRRGPRRPARALGRVVPRRAGRRRDGRPGAGRRPAGRDLSR